MSDVTNAIMLGIALYSVSGLATEPKAEEGTQPPPHDAPTVTGVNVFLPPPSVLPPPAPGYQTGGGFSGPIDWSQQQRENMMRLNSLPTPGTITTKQQAINAINPLLGMSIWEPDSPASSSSGSGVNYGSSQDWNSIIRGHAY